jgi:hypothetical protein
MKKLALALLAFISMHASAQLDCSVSIEKMTPYQGVIGEVLVVEEIPNTDPDLVDGTGTRYDFSYILPNGYVGWTGAVFTESGLIQPSQKVFWAPANKAVRNDHPGEDRQVFIVMGDGCRPLQIDFSLPAGEIIGL